MQERNQIVQSYNEILQKVSTMKPERLISNWFLYTWLIILILNYKHAMFYTKSYSLFPRLSHLARFQELSKNRRKNVAAIWNAVKIVYVQ